MSILIPTNDLKRNTIRLTKHLSVLTQYFLDSFTDIIFLQAVTPKSDYLHTRGYGRFVALSPFVKDDLVSVVVCTNIRRKKT